MLFSPFIYVLNLLIMFSSSISFGTIGVVVALIATILLTKKILARTGKQGCISFGYFGLVIFMILQFAISSWGIFSTKCIATVDGLTNGTLYTATVVDFSSHTSKDSEDRPITMYTPKVTFTTQSGHMITKNLDFSTSSLEIGDTYKVRYDESTDRLLVLGFTLIITLIGSFIFASITTTTAIGIFPMRLDILCPLIGDI